MFKHKTIETNHANRAFGMIHLPWSIRTTDVARAFPGGWLAHPEGQNEEDNK